MKYPLLIMLMLAISTAAFAQEPPRENIDKIYNLKIVMTKLRETMIATNDLDAMKEMGMPENELNRLKQALHLKVQQLTEDAVYVIRSI